MSRAMTPLPVPTLLLAAAVGACVPVELPCEDDSACEARSLVTGVAPNDVRLSRCGDTEVAAVPSSFDARVDAIALDGAVYGSVFFGVGANPWAVAGEAERLWVTLFGANTVALADACAGAERGRVVISAVVEVNPPVELRAPQDVDGDGTPETLVTRMTPRTPEAVVARGGDAWVTYSNLLEASATASEPPRFGPGVVARFSIENDAPVWGAHAVVPCVNPQGLALESDTLWVSCSGPLGPDENGAQGARADGALIALDADSLAVTRVIDMARFAPGTPALVGSRVVVGSLVTPRVAVLDDSASSVSQADIVSLPGADVDSVFEVLTDGVRVHAPVFSLDRLFSFDPSAPPATLLENDGVLVGPGGDAPRGLLALDLRAGFSVAGLALLGLSAQVVVLDALGAQDSP